jgi:hypothetical protein
MALDLHASTSIIPPTPYSLINPSPILTSLNKQLKKIISMPPTCVHSVVHRHKFVEFLFTTLQQLEYV